MTRLDSRGSCVVVTKVAPAESPPIVDNSRRAQRYCRDTGRFLAASLAVTDRGRAFNIPDCVVIAFPCNVFGVFGVFGVAQRYPHSSRSVRTVVLLVLGWQGLVRDAHSVLAQVGKNPGTRVEEANILGPEVEQNLCGGRAIAGV